MYSDGFRTELAAYNKTIIIPNSEIYLVNRLYHVTLKSYPQFKQKSIFNCYRFNY
jgi:hypothetical protein